MRLARPSLFGAACATALVVSAASALVACKSNQADRDASASYDYGTGATDKSGAGETKSSGDRAGTTTITSGTYFGAVSNSLAVERIVEARCARETACNNVGPDKRFTNPDICTRQLRQRVGDDLKPSDCPRGADPTGVDRCIEAIRTESCNNPIDTITRLAACRTSDLCLQ